jgi:hypothetical protein
MKKIIDSTDKKHIGEEVDETANPVVFSSGETMQVAVRLHGNTVLANSNYIIILSKD